MHAPPAVPTVPHPRGAEIGKRIDKDRLWARHMALAAHGATANGGVNRQALSAEDFAARATLRGWAQAIGLEAAIDPIGNLFLRLAGARPELPPVLTGSHLDSQPTGGRFDGVYGVLAGLEAIEAMIAASHRPERPIEVVVWTNEEGSRFAPGMMGSAAFAGRRALADIVPVVDADGVSVAHALERLGEAEADVPRRPLGFPAAAYIEAHIEQGPILEAEGLPIGVVTGIQGKRTFTVTVTGEEAHAGTTARRERKDALSAAAAIIVALERAADAGGDDVKFTIGKLTVRPNAPSVVPAEVVFSIDLRHPDNRALGELGNQIAGICEANRGPCEAAARELLHDPSLDFPAAIRDLIGGAADQIGARSMDILSAAGHDARHLHYVCPSGMIFVPCHKGISHNEAESATAEDLVAGAAVLASALVTLAGA